MTQNIITAGDLSNPIVFAGGNDGTLVIQTGPAGAKVNALSISPAGVVSQLPQSMVRLNTANGYGSTNTAIRRFTNVVTNQGTDITYADSATLGGSFTINTAGVYAISRTDQFSGVTGMGLSINSTQLAMGISFTVPATVLVATTNTAASYGASLPWTGYLPSGSVVRAHDSVGNVSGANTAYEQFTIVRVA
jgi:hypothetical protein